MNVCKYVKILLVEIFHICEGVAVFILLLSSNINWKSRNGYLF